MYCSAAWKVRVFGEVEVEVEVGLGAMGAVKGRAYHWERKPWGSSNSRQKKMGAIVRGDEVMWVWWDEMERLGLFFGRSRRTVVMRWAM